MNDTLEKTALKKLEGYAKPIKTKQLAQRLDIDRNTMAEILNKLHAKNLIFWFVPKYHDERQYIGWLRVRETPLLPPKNAFVRKPLFI